MKKLFWKSSDKGLYEQAQEFLADETAKVGPLIVSKYEYFSNALVIEYELLSQYEELFNEAQEDIDRAVVRLKDAFYRTTNYRADVEVEFDRVTVRSKNLHGEELAEMICLSGCFGPEARNHLVAYENYVTLSFGDITLAKW